MQKPIISLDIETTGTSITKDRIIEIACIKFDGENTLEKCIRVNPGISIPKEATKVHGISDKDVADKPPFRAYAKGIMEFISGCDILAYNGNKFDIPLLYMEFHRAGIEWHYAGTNFLDACTIFKRKEPRDLTAAMKFYYGETYETAHSALTDARATLKVFAEQLRRYNLTDEKEISLYSNYDAPLVDMGGWFSVDSSGKYILAKGKSKGTADKGFIEWMLKLDDLLPDARVICNSILNS